MDETVTPLEEFCADLDCIIEKAFGEGVSMHEVVGALTMQVQELTLIHADFVAMGVLDADAEDDEEEEV